MNTKKQFLPNIYYTYRRTKYASKIGTNRKGDLLNKIEHKCILHSLYNITQHTIAITNTNNRRYLKIK